MIPQRGRSKQKHLYVQNCFLKFEEGGKNYKLRLRTRVTVDDEEARALRDDLNGVEYKIAECEHWNKKADAALVEVTKNIADLMDAKELAQVSTARSAEIADSVLQDMKTSIVGAEENFGREIAQIRTRLDKHDKQHQVMFQSYNKAGNDACPGYICQAGRVHMTHHDMPIGTNGGSIGNWLFTDRVEIPVEGKYVFFLTAFALKDTSNDLHRAVLSLKTSKLSFPLIAEDSGMRSLPVMVFLEKGENVYLENGSNDNSNAWVANHELPLTLFGFRLSD